MSYYHPKRPVLTPSRSKYIVIRKYNAGIFMVRSDPRNITSPMIVRVSSNAIAFNNKGQEVRSKELVPGDQVYADDYEPNFFIAREEEQDALEILENGLFEDVSISVRQIEICVEVDVKEKKSVVVNNYDDGNRSRRCVIVDPYKFDVFLYGQVDVEAFLRKLDIVSFKLIHLSENCLVSNDSQIILPTEYNQFSQLGHKFRELESMKHFIMPDSIRFDEESENLTENLYSNLNLKTYDRAIAVENLIVMGNNIYDLEEMKVTDLTQRYAEIDIERHIDSASVELRATIEMISNDTRGDRRIVMKAMRRYRTGARIVVHIGRFKCNVNASYVDTDKSRNQISVYFMINKPHVEKNGESLNQLIRNRQWKLEIMSYSIIKPKLLASLRNGLLSNIVTLKDPTPAQMMIAQLTGLNCKVSTKLNDVDAFNEDLLVAIRQQLNQHQNMAITKILSTENPLVAIQTSPGCGRKITLRAAIKICSRIYDYVIVTSNVADSVDKFAKSMLECSKRPLLLRTFHKNVNRMIHKFTLDNIFKEINCDEKFESRLSKDELKSFKDAIKLLERRSATLRGPIKREVIKLEADEVVLEEEEEDEPEFDSLSKSVLVALKYLKSNVILGPIANVKQYCKTMEKSKVAIFVIDGSMLLSDALSLLEIFKETRKFVIFGDTEQIYREEFIVDDKFKPLVFKTALEGALGCKKAAHDLLQISYKFHPALFNSVSDFAYNGLNLKCGISAEDRKLLTDSGLSFANKGSPIVLVNVDSKQTKETRGYSNQEQEKIAYLIYDMIKRNRRSTSCIVISPYGVTRANMISKGVHDTDSFTIDKSTHAEADIAIILTIRTEDVYNDRSQLIDTEKRIKTLITRPKHGLIIVGDLKYLDKLEYWQKALKSLKKYENPQQVTGKQICRWHSEMPPPSSPILKRKRIKREATQTETQAPNPAKKVRRRIKDEPDAQ